MKVVLVTIGKTNAKYLLDGISEYRSRLRHYTDFDIIEIPNVKNAKNLSKLELIKREGVLFLNQMKTSDYIVLLDEKGKRFTSLKFADKLQQMMLLGKKRIIFLVGGAYGFSDEVYNRSMEQISLSEMTFSHQMIRLFFVEQLYRGFSILNNEPYHHK